MNDDEFNAMVDKIQDEVFAEAKNVLGAKGFDRWRNPKFCGKMEDADSFARMKGSCGDTMEMYLKFSGDCVERASYVTDGCGSSSVAGSFAAELAMGKNVEQIFEMSGSDVLETIGSFPEAEEHCAYLAMETLHEALNQYMVDQAKKNSSV